MHFFAQRLMYKCANAAMLQIDCMHKHHALSLLLEPHTFSRQVRTEALEEGDATLRSQAEAVEIEPVRLERQSLLH